MKQATLILIFLLIISVPGKANPVELKCFYPFTFATVHSSDKQVKKAVNSFHQKDFSRSLSFADRIISIFNVSSQIQNEKYLSVSDLAEEGELIFNTTYQKLKKINFKGKLELIKPIKYSYSELMMAVTEFAIFSGRNENILTVGLDYLSSPEVLIYNESGRLMTKVILADMNQVSVEIDISRLPAGKYYAYDGNSRLEFFKK